MFLDLPDREFGQVLVDFGDDPAFHVGMKGVAQFRERTRRGNDYDRFDLFSAHHLLQSGSHTLGETFLFQFMPIGRVYTAAQVCAGAFEDPSAGSSCGRICSRSISGAQDIRLPGGARRVLEGTPRSLRFGPLPLQPRCPLLVNADIRIATIV